MRQLEHRARRIELESAKLWTCLSAYLAMFPFEDVRKAFKDEDELEMYLTDLGLLP
jgi:hypothetical protein